ncbi:MAG: carbohydrate kinase, partial [Clostridia bacterium]|nr:carbohydrate kinase [Clostridia bacterium]
STKVTPIDTTGAGDAFFGTALQGIDNLLASHTPLTVDALIPVTERANLAGAEATQKLGAI